MAAALYSYFYVVPAAIIEADTSLSFRSGDLVCRHCLREVCKPNPGVSLENIPGTIYLSQGVADPNSFPRCADPINLSVLDTGVKVHRPLHVQLVHEDPDNSNKLYYRHTKIKIPVYKQRTLLYPKYTKEQITMFLCRSHNRGPPPQRTSPARVKSIYHPITHCSCSKK